jgi:hypothetical protein
MSLFEIHMISLVTLVHWYIVINMGNTKFDSKEEQRLVSAHAFAHEPD